MWDGVKLTQIFKLPPMLNVMLVRLLTDQLVDTIDRFNMYRLRKALKRWKVDIHSRRGVGYWLDDETKTRIREMIDGNVAVG